MLFYSSLALLDTAETNFVEQLFDEYKKNIYEIAFSILHCHQDAEDTLDEVMINIIKNIDKFYNASTSNIESQIVIYSRNAAINLYRKNKRRNKNETYYTYESEDNDLEEIEFVDNSATVDEQIVLRETVDIISRHMRKLTEEQIDAIKLVCVLGYSNVEAAQILNITPNAVGLRLLKAKRKLIELAGGELCGRL